MDDEHVPLMGSESSESEQPQFGVDMWEADSQISLSDAPPALQTLAGSQSWWAQSRRVGGRAPCYACLYPRNAFVCTDCLQMGGFAHTHPRMSECLVEKRMRDVAAVREVADLSGRVAQLMGVKREQNRLSERIRTRKNNIKALERAIEAKRARLSLARNMAQRLAKVNRVRRERIPEFERKVEKIRRCALDYRDDLGRQVARAERLERDLTARRRVYVQDLATHVFPISQLYPSQVLTHAYSDDESEDLEEDEHCLIMESLSEAMATSYINGRWVETTQHSHEMRYRIVESVLAASGDYTEYLAWKDKGEAEELARYEQGEINPAHTIASGLMLTTQLTLQLAAVLDVLLPQKIRPVDFGALMTSEYHFCQKVKRLNYNIVHLAILQGIQREFLNPKQTLHNLELLIDSAAVPGSDFGKSGLKILDFEPLVAIHTQLVRELETKKRPEDAGSDWDDDAGVSAEDAGWESINREDIVVPVEQLHIRSRSPTSFAISSASTLLSSLFRGPTSPRRHH